MKENGKQISAKTKKGFTLVELLVVIAILGILAAVSVVGYTTYIGKANDAKDSFVVDEMNEHLRAGYKVEHDGEDILYPSQIQSVLEGKGYYISSLVPTKADVYYAFDTDTDTFLSVEKNGDIHYDGNANHEKGANLFVFVGDEATRAAFDALGYSSYIQSSYADDAIEVTGVGIDLPSGAFKTIKYSSEGSEEVTIHTDSFYANLEVDAPSGTVHHYGNVDKVTIKHIASSSYHEEGIAGFTDLQDGHLVVSRGAVSKLIYVGRDNIDKVEVTNEGTVYGVQTPADGEEPAKVDELSAKVQNAPVYGVESEAASYEEGRSIIYNEKYNECVWYGFRPNTHDQPVLNVSTATYYDTLRDAFYDASASDYAYLALMKDVDSSDDDYGFAVNGDQKVVLDLNGHDFTTNQAFMGISGYLRIMGDGSFSDTGSCDNPLFWLNANGKLVIDGGTFTINRTDREMFYAYGKDCNIQINGGVFNATNGKTMFYILDSDCNIQINDGTLNATTGDEAMFYDWGDSCNIEINGGMLNANNSKGMFDIEGYYSKLVINGGALNAETNNNPMFYIGGYDFSMEIHGGALNANVGCADVIAIRAAEAKITIDNGTIDTNTKWGIIGYYSDYSTVNVAGGTFNDLDGCKTLFDASDSGDNCNTSLSGGTFNWELHGSSTEGDQWFMGGNYTLRDNGDGTYTVVPVE